MVKRKRKYISKKDIQGLKDMIVVVPSGFFGKKRLKVVGGHPETFIKLLNNLLEK